MRPWIALVGLLFGLPGVAAAQDEGLVIPVRVVNGHLIVLTELVGLDTSNRVSFEISFASPDTLTLDSDQYEWLGVDLADVTDATSIAVRIAPNVELSIPVGEIATEKSLERVEVQNLLTKLYSSGMDEHKLKGTIGLGLLKKYHVTLDIPEQRLILAPPRAPDDRSPSMDEADIVLSPFTYADNAIQIPVAYADNRNGRMAIGGADYDTFIDSNLARSLNRPAGNVEPVWLIDTRDGERKLDLSRSVAFRPRTLDGFEEEKPALVAGVNVLEQFRVELDSTNQTIAFTRKRTAAYPRQDFEFFQAEILGTADAMQAYLDAHPHERLSPDAAHLLVQWRVEKDHAGDEDVMDAIKRLVETSLPGRRAESCLHYVEIFSKVQDRAALAIATAKEGLIHAREAFDPTAVYALHNALGQLFMDQGDLTNAWKHFLSVAFMLPDDVETNLNLARVYDRQGRARRAYSRYKRVAAAHSLGPEIDAEVTAAMERLRHELSPDDVLLTKDTSSSRKPGE